MKKEKTLRKCSHLKKINKRHAGSSVQSIQIKIRRREQKNAKYEQSTYRFNIYLCEQNPFISFNSYIFFLYFVPTNLNLSSARCQHRFGIEIIGHSNSHVRHLDEWFIPNALVKWHIFFLHGNFATHRWWPWFTATTACTFVHTLTHTQKSVNRR